MTKTAIRLVQLASLQTAHSRPSTEVLQQISVYESASRSYGVVAVSITATGKPRLRTLAFPEAVAKRLRPLLGAVIMAQQKLGGHDFLC